MLVCTCAFVCRTWLIERSLPVQVFKHTQNAQFNAFSNHLSTLNGKYFHTQLSCQFLLLRAKNVLSFSFCLVPSEPGAIKLEEMHVAASQTNYLTWGIFTQLEGLQQQHHRYNDVHPFWIDLQFWGGICCPCNLCLNFFSGRHAIAKSAHPEIFWGFLRGETAFASVHLYLFAFVWRKHMFPKHTKDISNTHLKIFLGKKNHEDVTCNKVELLLG